ncbi:MAG: hypothetical protein VKP72_09955 [bacterium]|nr:hypothetical protein [bacterium]
MRAWIGFVLGTLVILGGCQGGAAGGGGGGAPSGRELRALRGALGEAQIEATRAETRLAGEDPATARVAVFEVRRHLAEARRHAEPGMQVRIDELDRTAASLDRQMAEQPAAASVTAARLHDQLHGLFTALLPSPGGGAGPAPQVNPSATPGGSVSP